VGTGAKPPQLCCGLGLCAFQAPARQTVLQFGLFGSAYERFEQRGTRDPNEDLPIAALV
jgi:hypothetical protein